MREFMLAQPRNTGQVSALLSRTSDVSVLMAGGTDLLDEIKNGTIQPEIVVDLTSLKGLDTITQGDGRVTIGALSTVASLAEDSVIQDTFPGLQQAALSLASPQLRNVGTVGGNLCQRPRCWYYRDPQVECRKKGGSRCFALRGRSRYHAIFGGGMCYIVFPSDLAPMLISLGAEATAASEKRSRVFPLEELYALPQRDVRRETTLNPGEFLTEISVPLPKADFKSAYHKIKERGTWDFAVVSAAVSAQVKNGSFGEVSIVCGGVAPIPWRMRRAEKSLRGQRITEDNLRKAAREDLEEARPLAENAYKVKLLEAAVGRAGLSLLD